MLLAARADWVDRRRILIVDDSRDFADTLATLLERRGFEVRVAYDGRQALDVATVFEPEAIICDLVMPSLDGYQVARLVRRDRQLSTTLLVAITGFPTADGERRARQEGFDGFFLKPVDGNDIIDLFERLGWRKDGAGTG